ncbi:MAG: beta-ketoacyl synthase N-terminal-like domain-containing protein [Planctomycetota bacterium]
MHRDVVVTGTGPICAAGIGVDAVWSAVCAGLSGVRALETVDGGALGMPFGGEVQGLKIRDCVPKSYRKATKVMARDIELAVAAAKLAVEDAGLVTRGSDDGAAGHAIDGKRTGCHIGAGQISADPVELGRAVSVSMDGAGRLDTAAWGTEGAGAQGAMDNLPPLWLLKYLPNMLACHVTIIHGCEGPSNTIMGAEAGALQSIGESLRVIQRGDADVCITGGAESRVNPMGLSRMRLAGRAGELPAGGDPAGAVRPFDGDSCGVIGEGGGMLILEASEAASLRGAGVYARVAGFGCGMDTRPMTPGMEGIGDPEHDIGLVRAIRAALADAGIDGGEVDAVAPMASGMPGLDRRELGALRAALGREDVEMITVTPNAGNMLAGHGGVTAALAAVALRDQRLPARVHGGTPMVEGAGACAARDASLRHVLVCSGSYGGQAAALVLSRV